MSNFRLIDSDDFLVIDLHVEGSMDSPLVEKCEQIPGGAVVDTTDRTEDLGRWLEVRHQMNRAAVPFVGWIEASFLGAPVIEGTPVVPPVDAAAFVAECVRFEASSQDDRTVGADYLLAWAWLETGLEKFGPQFQDTDAVGPFQIAPAEWAEYLTASSVAPGPDGRFSGYAQIDCAAWIGKRDVEAFISAMASGELAIDNYVPSLLNVFHCRLIGVPAAVEVQRIQTAKATNPPLDTVLSAFFEPAALVTLSADRKRYLGKDPTGSFSTVDAFVNITSAALGDGMKKAFGLLKTHVPGFLPPIDDKTVSAGWMAAAERELKVWTDGKFTESSDAGQARVKEYFTAATNQHSPSEAWCGAFVAWCLQQAGETAASTIVNEPERAANWKNWGDLELRQRDWSGVPFGAIVVLAPAENTHRSGHVAFFRQTASPGKIELLGGNQSNRVKTMVVERNKVVSIRWLTTLDVAPDDKNTEALDGAVFQASSRDQIILARTLYGEARGEKPDGIAAVASVVMNRVALGGWFGKTVEEVCLKRLQFSCWNASDPNRAKIKDKNPGTDDSIFDECFTIAGLAILGKLEDKTRGATHFHADTMRRLPAWAAKDKFTEKFGHHLFYRLK